MKRWRRNYTQKHTENFQPTNNPKTQNNYSEVQIQGGLDTSQDQPITLSMMNSLWMIEAITSHIDNQKENATFCKFVAPKFPKEESEPEIKAFFQSVNTKILDIYK